jgi:hypothetical protein
MHHHPMYVGCIRHLCGKSTCAKCEPCELREKQTMVPLHSWDRALSDKLRRRRGWVLCHPLNTAWTDQAEIVSCAYLLIPSIYPSRATAHRCDANVVDMVHYLAGPRNVNNACRLRQSKACAPKVQVCSYVINNRCCRFPFSGSSVTERAGAN